MQIIQKNNCQKATRARNLTGFTLIETVIYIAVASIVLGVILALFQFLMSNQARIRASVDVEQQGAFVTNQIRSFIRAAESIQSPLPSVTDNTLSLHMAIAEQDPIILEVDSGLLQATIGASEPWTLTDSSVEVTQFAIQNTTLGSSPGSIRLTLELSAPAGSATYLYSQQFTITQSLGYGPGLYTDISPPDDDFPDPDIDTIAPATTVDLSTSGEAQNSITISWTAPGDDETTGTASAYDIRFSTSPLSEANWDSANSLPSIPLPQPAGVPESIAISGLNPDTQYWFGLKSSDEVPNISDLSNVPSASTLALACSQLGYTDDDDDGYGVGSEVCVDGFATWASQGGDCYDQNANARPNQTSYFSSHRGDGSYDYNCVSGNEKRWTQTATGRCTSGSSICNGYNGKWTGSSPSCGASSSYFTSCQLIQDETCVGSTCWPTFQYCPGSSNRTQQCR